MNELAGSRVFPNATFIDLFAGIGGFRFALESMGAKAVFASEWDKYASKTYSANFGDIPAGDITKIATKDIPSHDIICGGFPCQPFSVSGKQLGFEDTRGTLFFDIARIIKYHKPKIIFLENVANLRQHEDGATIARMKKVLEGIGYDVNYKVLNASDFGVPQSRKRLYFVAFRKDLKINSFKYPEPTLEDIVLADILDSKAKTKKYVIESPSIVISEKGKVPRTLAPVRVGTINKGSQGDRIYSANGHAITLSAQGGGTASKTGAYLVNGIVRKLSPQECRRVQGFPESFVFPEGVSDSQLWKQFGNSVSVPVLTKILESIVLLPELKALTKPKR